MLFIPKDKILALIKKGYLSCETLMYVLLEVFQEERSALTELIDAIDSEKKRRLHSTCILSHSGS